MMHKYDTHIHTIESSHCGRMYAEDIVEYYHREKYSGIVITDHLNEQNFSQYPEFKKDWIGCVDRFLSGYRLASQRGAELGLDVILGVEFRGPESLRDTLIYGVDEEFLYRHEYIYELGLPKVFGLFKDRFTFIAAHPFRIDRSTGEQCSVLPQYIHGAEVINCNHRHDNKNDSALAFCRERPEMIRMFGSDAHRPVCLGMVYTGFEERIPDSKTLSRALKEKKYVLGYPSEPEMESEYVK